MISCEKAELLLSARLDGALSPREAARLEVHLARCPRCRAAARELEALHQEAAGLAQAVPPRLAQALETTDWAGIPQEKAPAKRKASPLPWAAGAAAALALVVAGSQLVLPNLEGASSGEGSVLEQLFGGERESTTASTAQDSDTQAATAGEESLADKDSALTQGQAQACLQAYLEEAGEELTLTCQGQEAGVWYFSGQGAAGEGPFSFAVDGVTGAVTPLPAEEAS